MNLAPAPRDEPVVYIGTIAGALAAIVTALQAFGVLHLSEEQIKALVSVVTIVGPVILALIQRRFVTPVNPTSEE